MSAVNDERMVAGLLTKGWSERAARQYVAEEAFRRRSRSRDGRGGNLSGSEGLNSKGNRSLHETHHEAEHDECLPTGRTP